MAAPQSNIDKKRMAKNTVLLYIRMFCLLLVGFYTVRLLLESLGVEDYGLYNVIFGLVTAFSFFSMAMQSTVQKFLCAEIGSGETGKARKVFGVSLFLFFILALLIILAAETIGLWFVHNKLNVPAGKMTIAVIVYQISIAMTILKVIQIPYIAAMTSHEDMGVYAKISILDAALHLGSVAVLRFIPDGRLICFSVFYTLSNFSVFICYAAYCWKKYDICRVGLGMDKEYLKSMTSFFSWNLLGAAGNISKQQGLNLLLNVFGGVILNATWGIATQVGSAVSQFYVSFQQAFNPQILKSYNDPDRNAFFELLTGCSKYSFFLIWLVALPLLLQTEFFLKLWLGSELPQYSVIFTRLTVVTIVIDAVCAPLWVAVQATGNIRKYQIEISLIICSTFVLSLIALKLGALPYIVAVINAAVNFSTLLYRLVYLHRAMDFPVLIYLRKGFIPIIAVGVPGYFAGVFLQSYTPSVWYWAITHLAAVTLINVLFMLFCGLSASDRMFLLNYCKRKSSR